jgi:spore coat polysaccharide biosynthesis predicted glycosyltransferase SpsG
MAKGDATIHAAGRLLLELLLVHVKMKLVPVADAFEGRTIQWQLP